jgi:hypothetical protein
VREGEKYTTYPKKERRNRFEFKAPDSYIAVMNG